MLPIHNELYENGSTVQQPILFINSYDFQWEDNIVKMSKMTTPVDERGMSNARMLTLM